MVKISDLVEIKKENFFNGAVQAEWFYDNNKRKKVSESYIFHGPKYYGVSDKDINEKNYKLIDTATFTREIYKKIYHDIDTSRFMMTIAGYGAGKSHLSLALASLLSGVDKDNQENILNNIKLVDKDIYNDLKKYSGDKQLVLVLNGINDFNLNMEILKVAKETLKLYGLDDSIFNDMSIAYKTARIFLERNYEYLIDSFSEEAKKYSKYISYENNDLKEVLLNNIEDYDVYSIINNVYKKQIGNEISITEGISANTVLTKLHQKYIVEEKLFNSIIILFDEFGRYLEFASNQPTIAGETGLQQIFEAVQNCNPSMMFIGFIQSDLNAYMSRVKNDNIVRYVGRYQISDKYYLSSNLETVIASLIKKKDNSENIIKNIFDNTLNKYFTTLHKNILRWLPELSDKNVWDNASMFNNTILKGSYPIHPITTSLLSLLSSYMQQRSTLTFLTDIFDKCKNEELSNKIPFIYPTEIIKSPIFEEILNAEERGRVAGQYCTQYKDLIDNNEESLSVRAKEILNAILIMNISKFKPYDKIDCIAALESLTGIEKKEIEDDLLHLENSLGLIFYDESIKRFNFMNDGNSKVDFNKLLLKKRLIIPKGRLLESIPREVLSELKIGNVEKTNFGLSNNIVTNDWSFTRDIIDIDEFSFEVAKLLKDNLNKEFDPDVSRGKVIYIYCNENNYSKIDEVKKYLKELDYKNEAILISLIYDKNKIIEESLLSIRALDSFNSLEKEKFNKFYDKLYRDSNTNIIRTYMECARTRQYISENGIYVANFPVAKEISNRFKQIYYKTIPFSIDSFEKKISAKSRKYYYSIVDALVSGKIEDTIEFETLPIDIKNRINTIFSVSSEKSWKVLYKGNTLSDSQNSILKEISDQIIELIKSSEGIYISRLFEVYRKAPYGFNMYSLSLVILYVIVLYKENIIVSKGTNKIRIEELKNFFLDDKKLKLSEFTSCGIYYTEENENDKIISIIEKIEKSRGIPVDKALEFLDELNSINELDIPMELRGRFFSNKDGLNMAKNISKTTEEAINEASSSLNRLSENPFLIVKIITDMSKIKEGEIEGLIYYYSLNQIEKAKKIKEESIKNIKKNLLSFENKNSVDTLQKRLNYYKKTSKSLRDMGYEELALFFDDRQNNILNKVNENKKINSQIIQFNNDLIEIENEVKLMNDLKKANNLIEVWVGKREKLEHLNNSKIIENYKKLNNLKEGINKIFEEAEILISDLKFKILNIKTIKDLKDLITFINQNLGKKHLESTQNELIETKMTLESILEDIQIYEYNKFSQIELDTCFNKLSGKYCNNKFAEGLLINLKNTFNRKIASNTEQWINKYNLASINIEKGTISELKVIKEDLEKDLKYLSTDCKEKYKNLEIEIDKKINKFKIENILSIFEELSEADKEICRNLLKVNK